MTSRRVTQLGPATVLNLTDLLEIVRPGEVALADRNKHIEASVLAEFIRDTIGAALTAGANITITPNDGSDTISIAVNGELAAIGALTPANSDYIARVGGVWTNSPRSSVIRDLLFVGPRTTALSLADTNSGRVYTNEGATGRVDFTLPLPLVGYGPYTFIVADTDGIRVIAGTGCTIRVAGNVSAPAGRIDAAAIGDVIELRAINSSQWVATKVVGAWTVT